MSQNLYVNLFVTSKVASLRGSICVFAPLVILIPTSNAIRIKRCYDPRVSYMDGLLYSPI